MKILITIYADSVAQRFDLAPEVLIANHDGSHVVDEPRTIIMSRPSAEELCNLIIKENITTVICGGIEERHYKFLTWKKINVLDSIIGDYSTALDLAGSGKLSAGTILPSFSQKGHSI
jgi:predicted Fe-Mo cluster-binding NifX family protein